MARTTLTPVVKLAEYTDVHESRGGKSIDGNLHTYHYQNYPWNKAVNDLKSLTSRRTNTAARYAVKRQSSLIDEEASKAESTRRNKIQKFENMTGEEMAAFVGDLEARIKSNKKEKAKAEEELTKEKKKNVELQEKLRIAKRKKRDLQSRSPSPQPPTQQQLSGQSAISVGVQQARSVAGRFTSAVTALVSVHKPRPIWVAAATTLVSIDKPRSISVTWRTAVTAVSVIKPLPVHKSLRQRGRCHCSISIRKSCSPFTR
jgi:hypothetical protein